MLPFALHMHMSELPGAAEKACRRILGDPPDVCTLGHHSKYRLLLDEILGKRRDQLRGVMWCVCSG